MIRRLVAGTCIALAFAAFTTVVRADVAHGWTSVGATAVPDEDSASLIQTYATGSIAMRSNATGTATVRWNVTAVAGLDNDEPANPDPDYRFCMRMLVRDTGTTARVTAKLQRIDLQTGSLATLAYWDSDTRAAWPGEGTTDYLPVWACGLANPDGTRVLGFNFRDYAYFIEATMTKSDAAANPGIKSVAIQKDEI
jgi:hypothetical protein